MIHPTSAQIDAVFIALRHFVDDAGYGRYINDDWINRAATAASTAYANATVAEPEPKSVIYRKGKNR